jgi:MerR HTH family regulatory protein
METTRHHPKRAVAARYGVTTRTVDRWHRDEKLGFPKPIVINGRNYYREDELSEFDHQCARRARETKVA